MPLSLAAPAVPDPMDAPAIRWGILAPGGIANVFAEAVAQGTRSSVVAAGSRSAERAQEFTARHAIARAHGSYADLVADPDVDAVYVASPHSEHHEHALLALRAGKPVLVEKAFTRSLAEAEEVLDAAASGGLLAAEAMWSRYLPTYDVVRRTVEPARSATWCSSRPTTGSGCGPTGRPACRSPPSPAVRCSTSGSTPSPSPTTCSAASTTWRHAAS